MVKNGTAEMMPAANRHARIPGHPQRQRYQASAFLHPRVPGRPASASARNKPPDGEERRPVLVDPSAGRSVIRQDEQPRHGANAPAAFPCDLDREPRLAVEGSEHRLHVRDHGLDLDDEQRPGRFVEGEDVDRSALAADVERDFRRDLPLEGAEPVEHLFRQCRVVRVESVEPLPSERTRTLIDAPRAAATATSTWTGTRSPRPRSMRPMTLRDTPTSIARRACVHRRRRRSARIDSTEPDHVHRSRSGPTGIPITYLDRRGCRPTLDRDQRT